MQSQASSSFTVIGTIVRLPYNHSVPPSCLSGCITATPDPVLRVAAVHPLSDCLGEMLPGVQSECFSLPAAAVTSVVFCVSGSTGGTATGRLSSDSPNMQNLPSKSVHGISIRNAICGVASIHTHLLSSDCGWQLLLE